MRSLDLYILRQCLTPFFLALVIVTTIVWMTQTLQRADIIIEYSQGLLVFARVSLLIVPSLLAVIIPFALFASALYSLQRLHSDSEIAVMFAAGVSRLRIAYPFLLVAAFASLATLWVNLDLMPRSYRMLKQEIANLRGDLAQLVLRSGEFTSFADGFTIYVEEARSGGLFNGILISDYRNRDRPETYIAQRALLRDTPHGPVLSLVNGTVQRVASETGILEFMRFDQLSVNVGEYSRRTDELQLDLTERYLSELFHPDMTKPWERANLGRLRAEGHNRLASPLYVFAFLFIGLYAVIGGPYSRRSYALRIILACAAAGATRVSGFVLQGTAMDFGAFWLIYVPPLVAVFACALLLANFRQPRRAQTAGAAR